MIDIPVGSTATIDVVVTEAMTVDFDEMGKVHPVYATYTMAKHFEEAGRKLLLRHLGPGEAGIGRSVSVEHLGPSWVGDAVRVTARCVEVRGNRLTCECTAVAADAGLARLEGAQQQLAAGLLEVLGHRVGRVHRVDRAELVEADGHLGRHHHVEDGGRPDGDGPHADPRRGDPRRADRRCREAGLARPSSPARSRIDCQASKSTVTASETGSDWQVSTYPASTSRGSRA